MWNARQAYEERDAEASTLIHNNKMTEPHRTGGRYLKSIVYGGLDGLVSTFAVVAGVIGADLTTGVLIILGVASLFADGISMAVGDFISSKAEEDHLQAEKKREDWEMTNNLEGEKKEMVDIFVSKGMSQEDASTSIEIMSRYHDLFLELMMQQELGLVEDDENPYKHGAVTFISFVLFGSVPVISYVASKAAMGDPYEGTKVNIAFIISCFFTGLSMFGLGALTSRFTTTPWWRSGLLILANGAFAATVAYFIGYGLSELGANA
eukprot:TRINITY_DN12988_c0_g1_i1.p1 TRINITY_DN12988_c0_g1~~TRINITY_DN12988_c0_g1_i1.p1  ORF type:complete len:265 (-),score=57.30 TRINITY_DN12988_c0_g1_i1:39-833(-)